MGREAEMAGKTQGEKIDELQQNMATLTERLDNLVRFLESQDVPGLLTRVALLEQRVEDLRHGKEEWARRLWVIVGALLSAAVGALFGYYLRGR
jgi:hypothetical protein